MTCWNVSSGSVSSVTTNAAAGARELTIRRDTEGVTDVVLTWLGKEVLYSDSDDGASLKLS